MNTDEYISSLRDKNVFISVRDGQIAVKAEAEALTDEIVSELTSKKQEVLSFFEKIQKSKLSVSIPKAEVQTYYPLSSAQRRMYFLYELERNSTTYNIPAFFRVGGNLDIPQLEHAFRKLIDRHESLRMLFEISEAVPMQRLVEVDRFEICYEKGTAAEIDALISDFVRPFDLTKEIPIRIALMEVENEDYLLMLDVHHIVSDGVSMDILMREFWSIYLEIELPSLPIGYKDYAVWQQEEEYQSLIKKDRSYWLDLFSDDVNTLELPTDRPRSLEAGNNGNCVSFSIDKPRSESLRALALKEGVTHFTLFLACYNVLLGKLSNQNDIVVGTSIAGRDHADIEGVVGMFVNTLVLRNQTDAEISFQEFLCSVQQSTLAAMDHQRFQYEDLVEALDLSRDASRNPLFDVFYSYTQRNQKADSKGESELSIVGHEMPYTVAKFDLELDVEDSSEGFKIHFTYNTSLFEEETIIRFSEYLERVIDTLLKNDSIKVSEIDILSSDEKNQIIHQFNAPELDYDTRGTIVDLIELQVSLNRQAKAILFNDYSLEYGKLNQHVNQLTHYLIDVMEVQKGDRIGVYLGRSPEMLISFLAVLKAGATYVPLDPANPSDRLNILIEDAEMTFLITDASMDSLLVNSSVSVLDVVQDIAYIEKMPTTDPTITIEGSDSAYVIFTSGSTGRPKGVVITHDALLDYSITFKNYFSLTAEDKVIQQASPAFDTVIEEVFPALIAGASIVIAPEGGTNIESLVAVVKRQQATVLSTVPIVLDALNKHVGDLSSLRVLISGGDLLVPQQIDKLIENHEIFNTYGPSESTVCISYHKIEGLDKVSCIGKPIANRQVYILDHNRQLCPVGVAGELCVSGKGLAKEYLNDIELTNEKFIDNPLLPGTRIYCTGDEAKWNSDGTIEFLGRIDNQVKIRGVRIELGEIEAKLCSLAAIEMALVVVHGTDGNKQLFAYLCGKNTISSDEIRVQLSEVLPTYMIPSGFQWLDNFPVNANGKLDKKALPNPNLSLEEVYVAPKNKIQEQLLDIWAEVLGNEKESISIHADFFGLGGHSLNAITAINKINKALAVEIPLRDLFVHRTIASLSARVSEMDRSDFISIPKAKSEPYYPLSSAQRRMYFLYELDRNNTTYNMPGFFRIGGNLDVSRLERVYKTLISRHESLRTLFEVVDGEPVQKIVQEESFELGVDKCTTVEIDTRINDFVRPFDLGREIPIRATLMEVEGEDHLLMFDMHHIASDGVSYDILLQDFWILYSDKTLAPLPLTYKDYATWQQGEVYQSLIAKDRTWWLNQFAEEAITLELPTDRPRPLERSYQGNTVSMSIDQSRSESLRALASQERITNYALFLACFNVLLGKLSNQQDIVVGTPIAGRDHADVEGVVGMFVNTLALRNQVKADMSFRDFLASVQQSTLGALDHQRFQYEDLVDSLNLSRDSSRNPLFDVLFNYGRVDNSVHQNISDITIRDHGAKYEVAKFDLQLNVVDHVDGIKVELNYNVSLFDEETIKRFLGYFDRIISTVLDNANIALSEVDVLSETERLHLLVDLNDTQKDYDLNRTVLDMFREQVTKTPDSEALVFEGEVLTYKGLDIRSDLWASKLVNFGVQEGDIVSLIMTRSTEMITAILAVMKAGAAYLPVNPDQPIARTAHILKECQVRTIITNTEISLENNEAFTWFAPQYLDELLGQQDTLELPTVKASSLAYIIYTSGSTGEPNGVMIHHGALSNLNAFQRTTFEINSEDRILQFSPYYFDASVEQIWLALTSGVPLVLISKETILDTAAFIPYLTENGVTYIHSTPSFLEHLPVHDIPSLRLIVMGGEACKPALANKLKGEARIINEYGPTEVTVASTLYEISETIEPGMSVPIGKPLANLNLYVLDADLNLLPKGVKGELYIGGVQLSAGYINKRALTAERFIENPFGEGRLYRTGDIVRWLTDGNIAYLGRNDDQVQIRGYRIELGEIEVQLEAFEQIDQSLVIPHGTDEDKQLFAYLCGKVAISDNSIRASLSETLPSYMIPAGYQWLESFPLNANGKIDKRALPTPDFSQGIVYVAPQNIDQERLVNIWAEVLGVEQEKLSINADFFRLGGHSLNAIKVINKINKAFAVELPLRDLFTHSTIDTLSVQIAGMDRSDFISIPTAQGEAHYPLSSAQRRMYFLYELDRHSTTYNMPAFYRIGGGNLDVQRLEHVYQELISRHESLRTLFSVIDGEPIQKIVEAASFELHLDKCTASDIEKRIADFVRPFDLRTEIPIRVSLTEVEGEDHLLMFDMHHIVGDGVSYDILMRDFWMLYTGNELYPLPLSYKDYAVWQQGEVYQSLISKDRTWWLDQFAEETITLELPTDRPRPLERTYVGNTVSISIDQARSESLRTFATAEGVTNYALFLACFNVLLGKLSNQQDIVVGTPIAGRDHADIEGIVGIFVNTLALRNQVTADMNFRDFLANVQQSTLEALDHQRFQYEELVDAIDLTRDPSRNPLFDVFFTYGRVDNSVDQNTSDITIRDHGAKYEVAKFDLQLNVVDHAPGFNIELNYNISLFDEETIQQFLRYFDRIISAILINADVTLSAVDVLSETERTRLLVDFNDTQVGYDLSRTVLDMFQEQVTKTPDSEALVFEGEVLTYKSLDTRSDIWASRLMNSGVLEGEVVGLIMTRSTEMIVAILAVMKAGAAYLPVNPDQPHSRTSHMLSECQVNTIIANTNIELESKDTFSWLTPKMLDKTQDLHGTYDLPLVKPSSLAYIIYTSGSTGEPKGVMIHHRSVTNLNTYQRDFFEINQQDRILQFSPYYFDTSVEQIWLALTSGVPLVLISNETILDTVAFTTYLNENEVTYIHSTPSFLEHLPVHNIPSLRLVISAGEPIKPFLANKLQGTARVINEYGPTEATVISTLYEISETIESGLSVPIGKPLPNLSAYVLDDNFNLLPEGVKGELFIGGVQLSEGYINRPELTAERFIDNPYGEGRLYRTGDIVRWLPDGNLAYLGRNDDQVQIRGFRIELREIEAQLERLEIVDQAMVIVYGNDANKQLFAYLIGNIPVDDITIKELLSETLPSYMIPAAYQWMDAFPLTPNGKIDKKSFSNPELTSNEVYMAPQTDNQRMMVILWSETLGIEASKIGIDSNFFNLGGHSLLAMKLKYQIKETFDVELSLAEIFMTGTIRAITKKIEAWDASESADQTLVLINEGETESKILYMIHDGSGEIDGYLELARKMNDFTCYGLKFNQFENMTAVPTIQELAAKYVQQIRDMQPSGPYHLLGWSLGGEIAVAITAHLESMGEEVENLMLIDTTLNFEDGTQPVTFDLESEAQILESKFGFSLESTTRPNSINELWSSFSNSEEFASLRIEEVRNSLEEEMIQLIPDFFIKTTSELFDSINKIRVLGNSSFNHTILGMIKANTLYIRPVESGTVSKEAMQQAGFENLEVTYVEGDHFSIMKVPHVRALSEVVNHQIKLKSKSANKV